MGISTVNYSKSVLKNFRNVIEKEYITFNTENEKNFFEESLISLAIEGEVLSEKEIISAKELLDGTLTKNELLENIYLGYYE